MPTQHNTFETLFSLNNNHASQPLQLLSLFSGCGGMDLGFEGDFEVPKASLSETLQKTLGEKQWYKLPKNNFRLVFANDIFAEARHLWLNYLGKRYAYAPDIYHQQSIVDLVKAYREGKEVFPQKVDVLTGGFPCQDFSIAGKRRGFASHRDHQGRLLHTDIASEETRGKLYMWMKEVISITQPKVFIAENVKGLFNLDDVKDIIQQDFSAAANGGYLVLPPRILHAARYGVAQNRERVIFIGVRRSALRPEALAALEQTQIPTAYDPYPTPTHRLPNESNELPLHAALQQVLADLPEPEQATDWSQKLYSKAKFMGLHCQGQKEIDLTGIAPTIRSEHHGNIEFRRLSAANGGQHTAELQQGLSERRLTPRECALIQSFPPDYDFVLPDATKGNRFLVSASAAYKAIGNAVPPLLAYHLAQRLSTLWSLYFAE